MEGNWKEFLETLDHRDIDALKSELCRIKDRAKREELAGKVARKLKLPKGALIGDFQEPEKGEPDSNGARPVKISPTSEPWAEKVKVDEVLDEICAAQARFLWMKPSQRRAVALAIVLTYLHDIVDVLPILLVTSPEEECGKSTLLKFILFLSNRPLPASNISASAIFRTIEAHCPTLILDEADSYLQENEEMRGVINSGHEREFAYVIRTVSLPNGELATAEFSTWCPKAIAQIGLPKRTILSRSVHIRLGRKPKNVKTEKLRKKHYEEFGDLRRKISRLANDIRDHVKTFENDSLDNRAGDNWGPLFAIASGAGEESLEKTMLAARRMSQKDAQEMKSFGRYLLESLDRIIVAKREKLELPPTENIFLRSLDLVNELNQDDEAPWKDGKSGELNSTAIIDERWGSSKSRRNRVKEGPVRGRGYWSDDIEKEIQSIYTPRVGILENCPAILATRTAAPLFMRLRGMAGLREKNRRPKKNHPAIPQRKCLCGFAGAVARMAGKFHKNRRVAAAHTENFMNTKDKNDGRPSRDDAESLNKGNLTKIPGSGMLEATSPCYSTEPLSWRATRKPFAHLFGINDEIKSLAARSSSRLW